MKKGQVELFVILGIVMAIFIAGVIYYEDGRLQSINEGVTYSPSINSQQIVYNGSPLRDDSVYVPGLNICYVNKFNFQILVSPCITQDADGKEIVQDVAFGWNGTQAKNISFVFVYEGDLATGKMLLLQNNTINYEDAVISNAFISNYLVDKIVSFQNISPPSDFCDIGNKNNTQMFRVTRQDGTTKNYCFTSSTTINATSFRISGNYDNETRVQKSRVEQKYIDISNLVVPMGKNLLGDGFSYYKVHSATFQPGQEYKTKWIYSSADGSKKGKWNILAYDTETGLINSINSGAYVFLDPWWNNSWSYKRSITTTGRIINMSSITGMNAGFSDIRFLDTATEATEQGYWIERINNSIAFVHLATNGTKKLYYGNPTATSASNIENVYPGLKSYYPFDEGSGTIMTDNVGGRNITTAVTTLFNASGKIFSGYMGNDANNYDTGFDLRDITGSGNRFQITFWLKRTGNLGTDDVYVSNGVGGVGSNGQFKIFTDDGADNIKAYFKGASALVELNGNGSEIPLNTWVLIGLSYDGASGNLTWNGQQLEATTQGFDTSAVTQNMFMFGNGGAEYLNGNAQLDDIRFYNHSLSQAEFTDLINNFQYGTYSLTAQEISNTAPNVTLLNPANGTVVNNTYSVYFGANITDDYLVDNSTLYIWYNNGSLYNTYFTDHNAASVLVNQSVTLINGNFTWNYLAYDNLSLSSWGINRSFEMSYPNGIPLNVSTILVYPQNGSLINTLTPTFNWSVSVTNGNITNTTIFYFDSANPSNCGNGFSLDNLNETIIYSGSNITNVNFSFTLPGTLVSGNTYGWCTKTCVENSTSSYCSLPSRGNYTIDLTQPTVTINSLPNISTTSLPISTTLNATSSDAHLSICSYSTTDNSNRTIYTCNTNTNISFTTGGYKNVTVFANDTLGNEANATQQIYVQYLIATTNQTQNTTIEGKKNTFSLLINSGTALSLTNASLFYNNTYYGYDNITQISSTVIMVQKSLVVPYGNGNLTGRNVTNFWNYSTTSSDSFITSNSSQIVYMLNMSICGAAPYNIPFLNYTFHNETIAGEAVKATFDSAFTYWIDDQNTNKTYSYSSAIESLNYTFCFTPAHTTVNVFGAGTYDNSVSQSRTFVNTSMALSNTTTTQDLLLLPTTEGIYITFVVQNTYNQRLSGALIDIKKTSDGSAVEQKYTDGTGIAAFWLDTSTDYTVTVTKSGYSTYATGITPVSSPVTITMTSTSSGGGVSPNINSGIRIRISPMSDRLANYTAALFQFNISSSTGVLDSYGFSLWNTTTLLNSGDSGTNEDGESLSVSMNTFNQTYIIMKYYYIVGGNITNGTKAWYVSSLEGSEYSIAHAFDRLNNDLSNSSNGLFGIKRGTSSGDFSLAIIIFIIIMFSAGVMTYKYGITSTTAVTFLIFGIILFADVGAGLIPNPVGAVPHFVSIFAGFILVGMFVKEMVS